MTTTLEEKFEKVIEIFKRVAAIRMWESAEKACMQFPPQAKNAAMILLQLHKEKERLEMPLTEALDDYLAELTRTLEKRIQ